MLEINCEESDAVKLLCFESKRSFLIKFLRPISFLPTPPSLKIRKSWFQFDASVPMHGRRAKGRIDEFTFERGLGGQYYQGRQLHDIENRALDLKGI